MVLRRSIECTPHFRKVRSRSFKLGSPWRRKEYLRRLKPLRRQSFWGIRSASLRTGSEAVPSSETKTNTEILTLRQAQGQNDGVGTHDCAGVTSGLCPRGRNAVQRRVLSTITLI
jgi:hypothetical protein